MIGAPSKVSARPHVRAAGPRALWAVAALAGCSGDLPFTRRVVVPGDRVNLHLQVRAARSPDALRGTVCDATGRCLLDQVASLRVILRTDDPPQSAVVSFDFSNGRATLLPGGQPLEGLRPSCSAQVTVWGLATSGLPYSVGRSPRFELPAEGDLDLPVYLAVADAFSAVGDEARCLSRAGAAVVSAGDGRIFVVGGRVGDRYVGDVCVYDHWAGQAVVFGPGPQVQFPAALAVGNGRILVAGGLGPAGPEDALWLIEGGSVRRLLVRLNRKVYGAQAAWFPSLKKLLVLGGFTEGPTGSRPAVRDVAFVAVADLEPQVEASSLLLKEARGFASATPLVGLALPAVLLAGGRSAENGAELASAETATVDDAGSLRIVPAANAMPVGRVFHSAVEMTGGNVFIYGGSNAGGALPDPSPAVFSPLYDKGPAGTFGGFIKGVNLINGQLAGPRAGAAVASLPDGTLLVAGGAGLRTGDPLALLFSPAKPPGLYAESILEVNLSKAPDPVGGAGRAAVPLPDGAVFTAGGDRQRIPDGLGPDGASLPGAEIYVACADSARPCPK